MKYILKYRIKSKYLHFIKEYYKEYNELLDIVTFIANNDLCGWRIYKVYDISFSSMVKGEK